MGLSNHKLPIDMGRFLKDLLKNLKKELLCSICKLVMEDEYQFSTVCPAYEEKGNILLSNSKK